MSSPNTSCASSSAPTSSIELFNEWSKQIGAYKHMAIDLTFISPECGIGGILNSDISASEDNPVDLLSVPLENCLNVKNMNQKFKNLINELSHDDDNNLSDDNSEQDSPSQWKGTNMFENGLIIFYLFLINELHVEGEKSRYYPYLNLLPKEFTTAIYFDEDEMAALRSTNLYKSVQGIQQNLKQIYQAKVNYLIEKFPQMFDRKVFTFERFMWAFSAVWSRVFPIEYPSNNEEQEEDGGNGVEIVPTLLPTVDILNHKFNAKITYFTGSDRRFYLKTRENLKCGDSVYNNYGAKSNDSFLLSYGFVIPNNSEDTLYVQFGISGDNEELVQFKKKYLEDNSLNLGFYLKNQQLPEDMLDSIRICTMTEDDFYFAKQFDISHHREQESKQSSPGYSVRFSVKNEFKMLHTLRSLFISKKKLLFSTSIEEDEEELTREHNFNMQNILIYRIGQKKIIENALKCIDEKLSILVGSCTKLVPLNTTNSDINGGGGGSDQENILNSMKNIFIENSGKLSLEMNSCNSFFHAISRGEDISKGEVLFIVKSEELIDIDSALDSPFGEFYTEAREEEEEASSSSSSNNHLDDEMAVIFYVMFELFSSPTSILKSNNHKKFFNLVLKHFNFHETPLMSERLQDELSGTNALDLIQKTRDGLYEVFEDVSKSLIQVGLEDSENIMTFENFLVAYSVFDLFTVGSETIVPLPAIAQLANFIVEFDDGNVVVKSLIDIPKDHLISFSALSLTKPIEDLIMYSSIYPIDYDLALSQLRFAVGIDLESLESLVTQEKLDILNSINNLSFTHYLSKMEKNCNILLPIQLGVLLTTDEQVLSKLSEKTVDQYLKLLDTEVKSNVKNIISAMIESYSSTFPNNDDDDTDKLLAGTTKHFIRKYSRECQELLSSLINYEKQE